MKNMHILETKVGKICIIENGTEITNLDFYDDIIEEAVQNDTPLIREIKQQLDDYFSGKRKNFELPLAPKGTEFQQKVWNALRNIPYGETKCYSEVAQIVGNAKASRAVGLANNKNPIAIIIPCHRVIGKSGKLVGYGGGLEKKEILLNIEKSNSIVKEIWLERVDVYAKDEF